MVTETMTGEMTGTVMDAMGHVMMGVVIDIVTGRLIQGLMTTMAIEACSDFGVGIEGNDGYSD